MNIIPVNMTGVRNFLPNSSLSPLRRIAESRMPLMLNVSAAPMKMKGAMKRRRRMMSVRPPVCDSCEVTRKRDDFRLLLSTAYAEGCPTHRPCQLQLAPSLKLKLPPRMVGP